MKYDVVVVGAGPAGSTAAKFLAEKGVKVLLLDKSKFPRDKPCGGGIPIRVVNEFPYMKEKNLVDSFSYSGYAYFSPKQIKVYLKKNEPIYATVLRKTFDHGLVKLAIESGADFVENGCEDVKIHPDKVSITLDNGTVIDSQIVVGADGIRSVVARSTGLAPAQKHIGICLYKEYPVSKEIMDQYFTVERAGHLNHEIFGLSGYGWVIPKKEHVNIGVGELKTSKYKDAKKANLPEIYKKYIQMLKDQNLIPSTIDSEKMQGGVVPIHPVEKSYCDRVILCGDAAGLVNPATGGGIEYAMFSGKMAATVIADALKVGDFSARRLSAYERMWKADFGKDIKLFLRVQRQWGKRMEKLIELASKDQKSVEIAFGILNGSLKIHKSKWKIFRRLLYVYLKNLF